MQENFLILTIISTCLDVKFFIYVQGFFKFTDCTPGYFATANMYPSGRLAISFAELASLS